ncbi:excalibur calcium-binding domain-containing protein [Glutamicibacter sp.]|uniref:excalibur calcium-binding domain-containing protein n=1 Tax=Glutamicibacter sp. TaxID=1931995 RepID=UPI0028BD9D90|nr:excalibur calcium-binding domain-containing protein [Glutamicibacter sp.]
MPIFHSLAPSNPANTPKRAAAIFGAVFALLITSGCATTTQADTTSTESAEAIELSSESPTPTPSESPTEIASFLGQDCEGDELVMEQGTEKLYCDADASDALVWVTQGEHDEAIALAKQEAAEKKQAAEKAAKEKAAAEKAAAEKKAAAKRAAAEERAAEKKAAAKKAAQEAAETPVKKAPTSTFYQNCSAVRAAGAAPIRVGDPGYSRKLDRDGDGVACE